MKNILLDTSIIIDYLRKKDKENTILAKFISDKYQQNISIVTHTELYAGKSIWENEKLYKIVEKLCLGMNIFSIDILTSKKAGAIRAHTDIKLIDAIIASTAIQNKCELVTLNVKDFAKIPHLKLFSDVL